MIIQFLRDLWEVESEIAAGWALVAEQINAELDTLGVDDDDKLTEVKTLGDALEQITVADLLAQHQMGFAVGAKAGLYKVVGMGDFNEETGVGQLYVKPISNHPAE